MTSSAVHSPTVVTLADERYALALAVMGRSLSDTTQSDQIIQLYVVDGGLRPETKQRLLNSWDRERLQVHFVSPQFGRERSLPVWGRLPPLTYVRVFVPLLVPEHCGKAIFLDSDVIIRHDIQHLWDADLGDHALLAVQDPAVPFVSSRDGLVRYRELGIPHGHPYFNAGVMVVDVDRWRRDAVSERVMEFVRRHGAELNYCDQDGLNAMLWQHWAAVDSRWQVQPRFAARRLPLPHLDDNQRQRLRDDPWILHFSGRLKPWIYRGSTQPDRLFYHHLDQTAWRGWRPRRSLMSWMYSIYDSGVRDWCYPLEQRGHALMRNVSRHTVRV
jgi:lipopolysaccharide biosynthesis glycosyltransferase